MMTKHKPSRFLLKVLDIQFKHRAHVTREYRSYITLFQQTLEDLSSAILTLNMLPKDKWTHQKTVQAVFFSKIPLTLLSAFTQVLHGEYCESLATMRVAYETMLRVCFIQKYPDAMWATLIKAEKGARAFVASKLLSDNLKALPKDDIYDLLSHNVHSVKPSIIADFDAGRQVGHIAIEIGYKYNQQQLEISLNTLTAILALGSRLFSKIFESHFTDDYPLCINDAGLIKFLKTMPNLYASYPETIEAILKTLEPETGPNNRLHRVREARSGGEKL